MEIIETDQSNMAKQVRSGSEGRRRYRRLRGVYVLAEKKKPLNMVGGRALKVHHLVVTSSTRINLVPYIH